MPEEVVEDLEIIVHPSLSMAHKKSFRLRFKEEGKGSMLEKAKKALAKLGYTFREPDGR